MFFLIESGILINLNLISRVELDHRNRMAKLWNAGVYEGESNLAYLYFIDPANKSALMAPEAPSVQANRGKHG